MRPSASPVTSERSGRTGVARDLTAFQHAILVVLADSPRYGLAIKRELEAYCGEEVNHWRLYPNRDDLVAQGLVEKGELDKRTNEYALSDDGLAAVEDRLDWRLDRYVSDDERAGFVRARVDAAVQS